VLIFTLHSSDNDNHSYQQSIPEYQIDTLENLALQQVHCQLNALRYQAFQLTQKSNKLTTEQDIESLKMIIENYRYYNSNPYIKNVRTQEKRPFFKETLYSRTLIEEAIFNRNKKIFMVLARYKPSIYINNDKQTALHVAILQNRLDMALFLVLRGASLVVQDKYSKTPLDYLITRDIPGNQLEYFEVGPEAYYNADVVKKQLKKAHIQYLQSKKPILDQIKDARNKMRFIKNQKNMPYKKRRQTK